MASKSAASGVGEAAKTVETAIVRTWDYAVSWLHRVAVALVILCVLWFLLRAFGIVRAQLADPLALLYTAGALWAIRR